MNILSTVAVYRSIIVLGIVAVSGSAALIYSEPMQRFVHVCALVNGQSNVVGVSHVASMAFAGDRAYCSSRLDHCLTILSRSDDGMLKVVGHIARESSPHPVGASTISADQVDTVGGSTIRITKDQQFLFAASDTMILLLERGPNGQWLLRATYGEPPLTIPRAGFLDFELSVDEKYLFSNRLRDGVIEVIAFDREAKSMARVQVVSGLGRCEDLATSPNGLHLYAASRTNRMLYAFEIDRATGKLKKLQEMSEVDCAKRNLKMVTSLRAAPDGAHVVMTCLPNEGYVVFFSRDAVSGALKVAQVFNGKASEIGDLNYPTSIAFAPDANTVFIGCAESRCVVAFRKVKETGMFKYFETIRHPTIERPSCLEVDSGHLFVCSRETGGVSVFRINDENSSARKEDDNRNRRSISE